MSISAFLEKFKQQTKKEPASQTETVRKIVAALDSMEPSRAKYLAAFAYILSRVARADMNISEAETKKMEQLIVQLSGLPEEQAILVVQIAKSQATLFGGTENFLVTAEFSKMASQEEKLSLLRCLFAVASADENISNVEEQTIKLIVNELYLKHDDFIAARLAYRDYLSVLKENG